MLSIIHRIWRTVEEEKQSNQLPEIAGDTTCMRLALISREYIYILKKTKTVQCFTVQVHGETLNNPLFFFIFFCFFFHFFIIFFPIFFCLLLFLFFCFFFPIFSVFFFIFFWFSIAFMVFFFAFFFVYFSFNEIFLFNLVC